MNKNKIRHIFNILFVIFMMLIIFMFSSQNAISSSNTSSLFAYKVINFFIKDNFGHWRVTILLIGIIYIEIYHILKGIVKKIKKNIQLNIRFIQNNANQQI